MFQDAARSIVKNSQYLSELDMKGDADFGINISSGFEKALDRLAKLMDPDIGTILITAGDVFVYDIGATIGGLLGRALQRTGKQTKGKRTLNSQGLATIFRTMLTTIKEIGGAKPGDKTLIDALEPAVIAAEQVTGGMSEMLDKMQVAAGEGAKATETMISRIGRSSYLGERSRGAMDPGATFVHLFLKAMSESMAQLGRT